MRRRYICRECGLRFEGRATKDGIVRPYDRAGALSSHAPTPARCLECAEREQIRQSRLSGVAHVYCQIPKCGRLWDVKHDETSVLGAQAGHTMFLCLLHSAECTLAYQEEKRVSHLARAEVAVDTEVRAHFKF